MQTPLFDLTTWPFWNDFLKKHPETDLYLVGGAVRDQLLGRPWKDADFVIRGMELKTLIKVLREKGEANLVGTRFGVVKFRPEGSKEVYDIALPRRERSLSFSGAYRDFDIQSDPELPIEEDLSRRDFTINAMAWHLNSGTLIDPFFGSKDLQAKVIRTVGAAVTRFQEDYSRMLRAVRFSCQLSFELSEKVSQSIKKMVPHLHDKIDGNWVIAREVISQEFLKALDANPIHCLQLMDELGLIQMLFPELEALKTCDQSGPHHYEGTTWNHVLYAFEQTQGEAYKAFFSEPILPLAKIGITFHDIGKPSTAKHDENGVIHFLGHEKKGAEMVKDICKRLNLGATEYAPFRPEELSWMVRHHLFAITDQNNPSKLTTLEEIFFSKKHPSKALLQLMLADLMGSKANNEIDQIEPFRILWQRLQKMAPDGTLPEPLVSGHDLLEQFALKPGPRLKELLDDAREEQLKGNLHTKKEALAFLAEINDDLTL